jgi:apolipoprotein N-acyltransferase
MSNHPPPAGGSSPYGASEPGSARRDNPKALWSLILGIVSLPITCLTGFGLVIGIPAVLLGWQARNQPTGRGMALTGLGLGALSFVFGVVWLVLLATGAVDLPDN